MIEEPAVMTVRLIGEQVIRKFGLRQSTLQDIVVVGSDNRWKRNTLSGAGLELSPGGEQLVSLLRLKTSECEQLANLPVKVIPSVAVRDVLGHREGFLVEGLAFEYVRQPFIELFLRAVLSVR